MNDDSKYYIPKTLDEPFKFIWLTLDELVLLIIPIFVLTFFLNALLTGSLIGGFLVYVLRQSKGEQGQNYLLNLMYWYLPVIFHLRATPPSYIRNYLG